MYDNNGEIGYLQYITNSNIQPNSINGQNLTDASTPFQKISNASALLQAVQLQTTVGPVGYVLAADTGGTVTWVPNSSSFSPNALLLALNTQTYIESGNFDLNSLDGGVILDGTIDPQKLSRNVTNIPKYLFS